MWAGMASSLVIILQSLNLISLVPCTSNRLGESATFSQYCKPDPQSGPSWPNKFQKVHAPWSLLVSIPPTAFESSHPSLNNDQLLELLGCFSGAQNISSMIFILVYFVCTFSLHWCHYQSSIVGVLTTAIVEQQPHYSATSTLACNYYYTK